MPVTCAETWVATTYAGHPPANAIDLNKPGGDAGLPVLASAPGTAYNKYNDGYGNYVDVAHADGWVTRYAHLSAYGVANGSSVVQGTQIGSVGSTGNSSGPHIHYEQRHSNVAQPITFNGAAIAYTEGGVSYTSANCGSGADSDQDGVPDSQDRCPLGRGTAARQGCPAPADVDGNGKSDLVFHDGSTLRIAGWGANNEFNAVSQQGWSGLTWAGLGDLDGNGGSDLVSYDGSTLRVAGWGANNLYNVVGQQAFGPIAWAGLGDVDGNGRSDLITHNGTSLQVAGWSSSTNTFSGVSTQPWNAIKWAAVGDVDGNGSSDLVSYDGSTLRVAGWGANNQFNVVSQQTLSGLTWAGLGDLDGNGGADLVFHDGSTLRVAGWGANNLYNVVGQQAFGPITWAGLGDVDGNGRSDLITHNGTSLQVAGWSSSTNTFSGVSSQAWNPMKWANGTFSYSNGSGSMASLTGTVRDGGGLPVRGVVVQVPGYAPVSTDASGAYAVPGVAYGSYTVSAEGVCRAAVSQSVTTTGETTLDFTLGGFVTACSVDAQVWDVTSTVLPLVSSDTSTSVALPFGFKHFGASYSSAFVSANGVVNFLAPDTSSANTALPSAAAPNGAIYGFWDHLKLDGSSAVLADTFGTAPNRRFVIEYRNVAMYDDPSLRFSFQIVLYEDPNQRIRLQYKNNTPGTLTAGTSATVGHENATGTQAQQVSLNKGLLYDGLSVRPK